MKSAFPFLKKKSFNYHPFYPMKKNWFTSLTFAKQIERVEKNAHLYKKTNFKRKTRFTHITCPSCAAFKTTTASSSSRFNST